MRPVYARKPFARSDEIQAQYFPTAALGNAAPSKPQVFGIYANTTPLKSVTSSLLWLNFPFLQRSFRFFFRFRFGPTLVRKAATTWPAAAARPMIPTVRRSA